jgi:hypothetical protein
LSRISGSDIEGALATMTDDAIWRIPDKKERSPSAGLYSKARIGALIHRMLGALENGLTMQFRDGKISSVREYLDTQRANVLFDGAGAAWFHLFFRTYPGAIRPAPAEAHRARTWRCLL